MYISIPEFFLVPVYYGEEDMVNIKKSSLIKQYNSYNNLIYRTTKRKNLVIGVSLPSGGGESRWPQDKKAMEKRAREKNIMLKFQADANTPAEQASQVENLISQGIDILILAPVDLLAAANLVEKAHKAGIKVVAYDRLIKNSDLDLFVSYNNVNIGELQGRFLTLKVPKGNYIILSGGPTDYNSKLIKEGAMEYIKPLVTINNVKIVTDKEVDNWDPKIAYKIVKDSLIANNNIDAILAPNDAIAGAVIQALKEQGLAAKVAVTGQDAELSAVRRIIEGTQSMTVFADIREEAATAIDAAINLATGEPIDINATINNGKIDVPSILITPISIDKNNVYEVLVKSGYYEPSQIYTI